MCPKIQNKPKKLPRSGAGAGEIGAGAFSVILDLLAQYGKCGRGAGVSVGWGPYLFAVLLSDRMREGQDMSGKGTFTVGFSRKSEKTGTAANVLWLLGLSLWSAALSQDGIKY